MVVFKGTVASTLIVWTSWRTTFPLRIGLRLIHGMRRVLFLWYKYADFENTAAKNSLVDDVKVTVAMMRVARAGWFASTKDNGISGVDSVPGCI